MLLDRVTTASDLKKFSTAEMNGLCERLREMIIDRVSANGGHLASNLGVVELTVSLHHVFNTPADKIIWDVGHQSYCHKILTGRYDRFNSIRKFNGISGFPKRDESEHDAFGTGHSSTSISAALGIIEGRDMNKEDFKVVIVIGDGAMTAGLAFEGLNNAGHLKKDLIVVLNDNEMSISQNVGALSTHLNRANSRACIGRAAEPAQRADGAGLFVPGAIFKELGFHYTGPVDGHDVGALVEALRAARSASGPVLLHVITKKGKGYGFSERNPSIFHGIGPFDLTTGLCAKSEDLSYSEVFGSAMAEAAAFDARVVAISAAMAEGTGLDGFAKRFPERFYDVGIAEAHAVTFAAGLATQGLKPVVAIYSTFLQRAYDQIVHDVCLQGLHVVFAIDRAGIVGEDGPTHNGVFDVSYLRHIPNMAVMAPMDGAELRSMLRLALRHDGPVAIRYPRGKIKKAGAVRETSPFEIGRGEVLRHGEDIALLALGNTVQQALLASESLEARGIGAAVINARFVKPLDKRLLRSVMEKTKKIITIEENALAGGFGSAVLEFINEEGITGVTVKTLGIHDSFVEQGPQDRIRAKYLLDKDGICLSSLEMLKKDPATLLGSIK